MEIQKENGTPIEGFALEDCIPIRNSGVMQKVSYKGDHDWKAVEKKLIRLRLTAENADVYSIILPNGEKDMKYWEFNEIICTRPEEIRYHVV